MLYRISNGAVELGAELILNKINFEIRDTEKIAVVGRNGCGKTTLLRLIEGELELAKQDSDESAFIAKSGKPEIGYLKQIAFEDPDLTVDEEIRKVFHVYHQMQRRMETLLQVIQGRSDCEREIREYTALQEEFESMGGYYYEKEYDTMFRRFGFSQEDKRKRLNEFSGGQQTKIAFIKLLLSQPDILLLDEPTNHLDVSTIEWLEEYLKNYKKAVVIVSHDRMFLDRIVDVVYEIEYQVPKRYVGNYTRFMELKRANYEKQKKDYELQQKEIARLETLIEKYKNTPTKVAMTRSKRKAIEHMELIEAPDRFDMRTFHGQFTPKRESGKEVLKTESLAIGYDRVLSQVTMDMRKGQRIGIIGGNGLGKSTFLKTIVGNIPALGGTYAFGHHVDVGYFDQQMAQYTSKKTVLDEFWEEYPQMDQVDVRTALGAFMFTQDDVFKTVDMLSGGEKVRLALCKIFKAKPNLLILDEPTNHMDIVGKESLEAMLKAFAGSVIFVSHDRYFVKQIADALLVFDEDGVKYLPYGYDEYMERKSAPIVQEAKKTPVKASKPAEEPLTKARESYEQGKERSRLEKRLKRLEESIACLETEAEEKKAELLSGENATDYEKLESLTAEIEHAEETLLRTMEEWEDTLRRLEEL